GLLYRWRGRIGMRGEETRHAPGQRRLAYALRAAEDPGLRQPPGAIGDEQFGLGSLVAKKGECVARVRSGKKAIAFRRRVDRLSHAHYLPSVNWPRNFSQ